MQSKNKEIRIVSQSPAGIFLLSLIQDTIAQLSQNQ